MQKSKIPLPKSFVKPSVTSADACENKTTLRVKDKFSQKIKCEGQRPITQTVIKDEKRSKNDNNKPLQSKNKLLKSKVTAEKYAPDIPPYSKTENRNVFKRPEAPKKNNTGSNCKVVEKAEVNKIKSTQASFKSLQSIKNNSKSITNKQDKYVTSKTKPTERSQNTTVSHQKEEINGNSKSSAFQNSTCHALQPNIQFEADERFRNMILSGKELSPGILKHTTLKTSFYDRPSLCQRSSLYRPPADPHKAVLKALENIQLEERRISILKKTECSHRMSPFKDRFTPSRMHTPIDAHHETIRKIYRLQSKQKMRSAKKVTFKLPDSDSEPVPEKENIQFRLSVISDKSEGSDQFTPEFGGTILPVSKEIPSSASPEAPVPESLKTLQESEVPSSKETNIHGQHETCHNKNDPLHGDTQAKNLQFETGDKDSFIPCQASEVSAIHQLKKSYAGDSNCRYFSQKNPNNGSEFNNENYPVKYQGIVPRNVNVHSSLSHETKKEDYQYEQKSLFHLHSGTTAFNRLRTSISSPELFRNCIDNGNLLQVKTMQGYGPRRAALYCSPSISSFSELRTSLSSPELRDMSYKDSSVLHNHPTLKARLYSPFPVSFSHRTTHKDIISDELLSQKTSDYIVHAPILTPLVMKNLADNYEECDLNAVRQKLEFGMELKENDSKNVKKNVILSSIVTHQQMEDHLADQECCIVLASTAFPDFYIRHIPNPIAETLDNGDEMHFVPVEKTIQL